MKVVRQYGEISKVDMFNATQGADQEKMIDHAGETIDMKAWILYDDVNAEGKEQTVLSIIDNEGIVYSTISTTFFDQFRKLVDFMGDDDYSIKVVTGTTKNGREYVSCVAAMK